MKALRNYSPQALHHFTRFDQVEQLAGASEATPDTGFMARLMMLCSLPRTDPGHRLQYKRVNGPYTLIMTAVGQTGLPYGNLPRLLLAWVCTEAVRTQSRELVLGPSLSGFMRRLGINSDSGGDRSERTRLRNQMKRLFNAHIQHAYKDEQVSASVNSPIASRTGFWWGERKPAGQGLRDSKIELGEKFFHEIIQHPVPLELNILKAMKRSSLGIDFYLWLTYRTFTLKRPLRLSWVRLYRQFGVDPGHASGVCTVNNFRTDCLRELKKIKIAWPGLNYVTGHGVLILWPSKPAIDRRLQLVEELPRKHLFLAQNRPLAAGRPLGEESTSRNSANAFMELLRAFFTLACDLGESSTLKHQYIKRRNSAETPIFEANSSAETPIHSCS